MPERRRLYDELLDYALYAPVGAVLSVVEDLPGLIEKGRAQLSGRVGTANVIGKFAVVTVRQRVERFLSPEQRTSEAAPQEPASAPPAAKESSVVEPVSADALAIPGYDSLAASQVVARLDGLSDDELELVREYEQSRRARRTILLRIAQLQSDSA